MKRIFGMFCILLSIVFVHWETKHFGNNITPQTSTELFCDVTALTLCITAMYLFLSKAKKKRIMSFQEWLKEQGYGDLFDKEGNLNLSLAETVVGMENITDETKKFLQELIDSTKLINEMEKGLEDYINETFGCILIRSSTTLLLVNLFQFI